MFCDIQNARTQNIYCLALSLTPIQNMRTLYFSLFMFVCTCYFVNQEERIVFLPHICQDIASSLKKRCLLLIFPYSSVYDDKSTHEQHIHFFFCHVQQIN
jgi:hypothetical protein